MGNGMSGNMIKTYVEGFDGILDGGIPEGHVVLVSGEPGVMKSSMTYYMLYHQTLNTGKTAVYITLEQSRESILNQMERMGLKTEPVSGDLHVLNLSSISARLKGISAGDAWMQVFKSYVSRLKDRLDFSLLAIDSLEVLETLARVGNRRTELFYIFEWLRDLEATIFLISEASPEHLSKGTFEEGYLSDGIISLKFQVVRDFETQRRIRCVKMREVAHDPSYHSLYFNNGKFEVTKAISE